MSLSGMSMRRRTGSARRGAAVAALPRLKVAGNKIVRADNNAEVVLRGANFMRHEHIGNTTSISAGFSAFRSSWGGNVGMFGVASRAVVNDWVHPYNTGTKYRVLLDQIVAAAKSKGCYVVFAPRWPGVEGRATETGAANQVQYAGIPPQEAIDSLAILAQRYINEPHVIFAAQVETNGPVTWAQARDYYSACAVAVYNVTMAAAVPYKPIVMTSGLDFGRDISGAVTNPVASGVHTGTPDNIVYKSHPYSRFTEHQRLYGTAYDAGLPVFLGEFGSPFNQGGKAIMEQTDVDSMLAFVAERKIDWTGWAFESEQSPTLVLNNTDFAPTTPYGDSVKAEMVKTPAVIGAEIPGYAPMPFGLAGKVDSNTQITWTWQAVAGATRYDYRINGGAAVSNATSTTFVQSGLTAGTAYTLAVRAVTAAGTSGWTSAKSVTTTGVLGVSRYTWDADLQGWAVDGSFSQGAAVNPLLSHDTAVKRTGAGSLKMSGTFDGDSTIRKEVTMRSPNFSTANQDLSAAGGTLSVWVRVPSGLDFPKARLIVKEQSTFALATGPEFALTADTWVQLTYAPGISLTRVFQLMVRVSAFGGGGAVKDWNLEDFTQF